MASDYFPLNDEDGIRMAAAKRWKWPLKKDGVMLALAQLESLKSLLLVYLGILQYAKIAARSSNSDVEILTQKTQLVPLIRSKDDAISAEKALATTVHYEADDRPLATASSPNPRKRSLGSVGHDANSGPRRK
ncbi:hypothetical protein LTR78_009696 [Recurvomyces mirabilis]|uniref:Uncharacterized protein n=1 Tax=Recurvomyces mirabilis TaxID=574656 RepID=A0AAE0TMT8_9PEZI|nr:hypothetical protein LTR78_009696 [Recurvomyces mirabilis]KAK5150262.1 hypothetical protein LTS14_010238 [Recurvomyces mirabilis]